MKSRQRPQYEPLRHPAEPGLALTGLRLVSMAHHPTGLRHDEILRVADVLGSGLIVVGAHGRHFVHQLLFGSTAERLLHRAKQPLPIVKRDDPGSYREVLVAVDFSECAGQAVGLALGLLPDAEVVLFHAVESPFDGHLRFAGVKEDAVVQHRGAALGEARAEMVRFVQRVAPDPSRQRSRVEYGYPAAGGPGIQCSRLPDACTLRTIHVDVVMMEVR